MSGGRPRRWETTEELAKDITAYFAHCIQEETHVGIYGFCDFVNVDAETFYNYESNEEYAEYFDTIKRVRQKAKAEAEKRVFDKTAGAVFQLVNLTRKDRDPMKNAQHQDLNVAGSLELTGIAGLLSKASE